MDDLTNTEILNLEVILQHYGLPVPQVKDSTIFFREICRILIDRRRNAAAVNCSCIFDLLHCVKRGGSQMIEKMIQLIAVTSASESGLRRLCDLLRGGGGDCFSLEVHPFLFKKFSSILAQDTISLVKLPGDINSYIHLPSLLLLCPDCYTLTIWYKFDETQSAEHEVRLFRCRTLHGGIECLMLSHDPLSHIFRFKLKSYVTNDTSRTADFMDFDLKISPNDWNLIAITQTHKNSETSFELFHNGSLILQKHLPYPFGEVQAESSWSFGSGLRGACGGIALYREKFTQVLSQYLFEGGPSLESLHSAVSVPLSSTESAGVMLGTSHTKGEVALLASKSKLLYLLTPNHFASTSFLPTYSSGRLFLEFMELTVIDPRVRIPLLTGLCEVECSRPWFQTWLNIGGTTTLLYLFWDYILLMKSNAESIGLIVKTVLELISLISTLIRCSVDAREKFIQEHGFHILSAGFRMVGMDLFVTEVNDFEPFKTLIAATLSSPQCGDELAAAFQGFLFDFELWGPLKIELRVEILKFIMALSEHRADVLYESIGIQKLLNILDLQLSSIPESVEIESGDLLAVHLSDVLLIMIRHCLQYRTTSTSSVMVLDNLKRDVSFLVTTLEVSCCSLTIERVLGLLHHLRSEDPTLLEDCLYATRFADTAALRLLCSVDLNLTLQVRKETFLLFLWQLMQTLHNLPHQLLKGKPLFGQLHLDLSQQKAKTPGISISGASAAIEYSRLEKEMSQAISAIQRIKEKIGAIEKIWILVNMFGCELNEILPRAGWPSSAVVGGFISVTNVLDLLNPEGPLKTVDPLIVLPFLLPLLSRCPDCTLHLRFLQDFRAKIRNDESSLAVLSLLPDNAWLGPLTLLFNLEIPQVEIRQSCFEVILEIITDLLIYRIRYFGGAAVETLKVFFASLNYKVDAIFLLPQIILLCLQQFAQLDSKSWNRGMLIGLGSLMSSIEEQQICGNKIVFRKNKKQRSHIRNQETTLESQATIQALVIFLEKFKSVSVNNAFGPREVKVVLPIIRIFIGCIQAVAQDCASEENTEFFLVDEICVALVAVFPYMSEQWRYFSPEAFRDMIISIIHEFRTVVESQTVSCNLRDRCTSVVMSLIQYFAQHEEIGESPVHLQSIINVLRPVQHCIDIESVFQVLFPQEINVSELKEKSIPATPPIPTGVVSPVDTAPDVANSGMIFTIKDDDEDEDFEEDLEEMMTPFSKIDESQSPPPQIESNAKLGPDPQTETDGIDNGVDTTPASTKESGSEETAVHAKDSVRSQQVVAPNPLTQAEIAQRHYYQKWRTLRRDALRGKQEAERLRSAQMNDLALYNLNVTKTFFKTLRGKIQLEIFLENPEPEWKLGVSHEGSFPARKRVLLRPKYTERSKCISYDQYTNQESESRISGVDQTESNISVPELDKILLQSSPGAIVDVISSAHLNPDPKGDLQSEEIADVDSPEEEDQQFTGLDGRDPHILENTAASETGYVHTGPICPGSRRHGTDSPLLETNAILICPSGSYPGTVTLTSKEVFFVSNSLELSTQDLADVSLLTHGSKIRRRKWILSSVSAVHLRRYRLRDTAVEVFLTRGKHKSFLLDFGSNAEDSKRRNSFVLEFVKHVPKVATKQTPDLSIQRLMSSQGIQQKWLSGEISNFDYLMSLNTLSGRSYNDLCQYPIMPWVIAQYSDDTIDLNNPKTFRDLSKPIGALNEKRLESFLERYQSCRDDIPPFMYGSHYSTMVGVVLHFLIRLQPFASLHSKIQNGHFDVPDRLFCSIPQAWEHNTTLLSEVKELTPEWFMLPDFLRNINKFDFGEMQNGLRVHDVELPPWASSPEEFIRINREALESDYVSQHLHEWIDLIFGYKQRGPHAVEANNVFYYLTYYGAVNRDLIADEATKNAIELQIAHFGQCPMQLFRVPHPPKSASRSIPRPLRNTLRPFLNLSQLSIDEKLCCEARCTQVIRTNPSSTSSSSIISSANLAIILDVFIYRNHFVCLLDSGHVELYSYSLSEVAKTILINAQKSSSSSSKSVPWATSSSSSVKSNKGDTVIDSDVILFDEEVSLSPPPPSFQPTLQLSSLVEELENEQSLDPNPSKSKKPLNSAGKRDVLVAVEKFNLTVNFRLPIVSPSQSASQAKPSSLIDFSSKEIGSGLRHDSGILFTPSKLLLSAGLSDGSVRIQDFDSYSGKLSTRSSPKLSGGAFFGHKSQVTSVACDELIGSQTDVIASCDISGQILVWTISRLAPPKQRLLRGPTVGERRIIVSRRPQKVFTTLPSLTICCDLSWQMGIVASASHGLVTIFSIERNERLHLLDIQHILLSTSMPSADAELSKSQTLWRNSCEIGIRRILLIDDGFFILFVDSRIESPHIHNSNSSHSESSERSMATNKDSFQYLMLCSLMGNLVRITQFAEPLTFLSCPNRSNILVCGFVDGMVAFLSTHTFETLLQFYPHQACLPSDIKSRPRDEKNLKANQRGAAITSVRLGPNVKCPTVMTISTESGGLYLRSLPDFVKWQRALHQSGFSQIVQAPIQAVKETLNQAQHYSMVASDAATAMASNAKSLAGETLSKMNNSRLFKGVGSLFGGKPKEG